MTVVTAVDHGDVATRATSIVAAEIRARPALVMGLPTGQTPVALYQGLVAEDLNWSAVRTFNLDEWAGVSPGRPESFRAFMNEHLFSRVNLPPNQIGFLQGDAAAAEAECARYERSIAAAGGIDLLVLGLGANGHIGFNEPGPVLRAETHLAALHATTRAANTNLFQGALARVPSHAFTLGMSGIFCARAILMMATGAVKAPAVAAMVHGPLTTACPASWLQLHPAVTLLVDKASAALLEGG